MPKSELVPTKGIYNLSHSRTVSSDFKIQATKQIKELPKFVDLSPQCSPITNQSSLGSCGSHAIVAGLREFLLLKTSGDTTRLSRLFHYYMARKHEGTINEDSGMTIRVGMQVIQEYGSCTEARDPYIIKDFKVQPSAEEMEEAKKYRLPSSFALRNILELKNSIAAGYPVVIGMEIFPHMESQEMAKKGVLQLPNNSEQALGGHAVIVTGYKETKDYKGGGFLIVRNSWGPNWGLKGYFKMPYEYVRRGFVFDMWTGRMS